MVYALTDGEFNSTSQQGMMVYLDSGGYYELQINNQPYQTGSFSINGNSILFVPDWAAQGSLTQTTASITGDCTFNWGQSGTFQNNNCGSNSNTGGNTEGSYATLDSSYNLYIPQLSINSTYYSITMALVPYGQTYYFKVTGVNQISPSNNDYTASFDSNGTLYIPVVEVQGYYYEVYLQLNSVQPDILFTIYDVYESNSGNSSNYDSGYSSNYDSGYSSNYDNGGDSGSDYYQSGGYDTNEQVGGYDSDGNYGYDTASGMDGGDYSYDSYDSYE